MEFTVKEIIDILLKRMVLISICTFVGFISFFIVNKFIIKPTYTASVQMYVDTYDNSSSADLNELTYAQKVVNTYINFLKTKVFYEQVLEACNVPYTQEKLKEMTNIHIVNNTEIFQISVTSNDVNEAYKIVKAMQEIAPNLIKSIRSSANINIVDPVVFPKKPTGPDTVKNTIIGGLLGFILSIMMIFIWEFIDVNVKDQEDLRKRYQLPILGAIPNFKEHKKRYFLLRRFHLFSKHLKQSSDIDTISDDTKFIITEAYKSLRTNLKFAIRSNHCKKILISSPVPEDGKSTTSTNLCISIAQTGAKVLLIDCDMRKGRIHRFFNLKSSPGLSDALSGMIALKDVISSTSYENLKVITLGSIPPNPMELLASSEMEKIINDVETMFDYIIIDTPPINAVSDSLSITKLVDGVILVVRENATSHPNITNAIMKYRFAETNLLGFIINGVSFKQDKKTKLHYYYNNKLDR